MIFPYLLGMLDFAKIPITWLLIALNLYFFIFTFDQQQKLDKEMNVYLQDEYFVRTQGEIYAQYLRQTSRKLASLSQHMTERAMRGDEDAIRDLALIAVRDAKYATEYNTKELRGDKVAIEYWEKNYKALQQKQQMRPSNIWGLTYASSSWRNWITYQFVHGDFTHLMSNLVPLLIFGTIIELLLGSAAFLLLYLGAGVIGVASFYFLTGFTTAPLIGASASVTGLIAMFIVIYWNNRVKFFYMLPLKNPLGFIFLPAWITALIFLVGDLAGYISSIDEFGGIAYTAHIGGALWGAVVGLLCRMYKKTDPIYTLTYNQ